MEYLWPMVALIVVVVAMAGLGNEGLRAGRSLVIVIGGLILLAVVLGLVIRRAV